MEVRTIARLGGLLAVVGGVVAMASRESREAVGNAARSVGRRLRYLEGQGRGLEYRLRGGHPDEDVPDDVLADRVRSALGPLEKRLDVPHVHVHVEDHRVTLHGAVDTDASAAQLVRATAGISGVRDVDSKLHVGLGPGDTRPSEGRVARSSTAP